MEFYTIKIDSSKRLEWVYSAIDFEKVLLEEFKAQKLNRLFVSLYGYLESLQRSDICWDFSYRGGSLLAIFDRSVLELVIHTEGMIKYRIFPVYELKYPVNGRIDYPPSDTGSKGDSYYYDLGREINGKCFGASIESIEVGTTDVYPFDLSGFDETLAQESEKRGNLPTGVKLKFENNVKLEVLGDEIEYFCVKIEDSKND